MGRVSERPPERAREVRARETGGRSEVVDPQRLGVPGVGQVLGAQEVTGGGDKRDGSEGMRRRNDTVALCARSAVCAFLEG